MPGLRSMRGGPACSPPLSRSSMAGHRFVGISFSRFLSLAFVAFEDEYTAPRGPTSLPLSSHPTHTQEGSRDPSDPLPEGCACCSCGNPDARLLALSSLHDTRPLRSLLRPQLSHWDGSKRLALFSFEELLLLSPWPPIRSPVLESTTGCCHPTRGRSPSFLNRSLSPRCSALWSHLCGHRELLIAE